MDRETNRWLIIPVEIQVRELMARLLVALFAVERGYRVLIGHDRVVRRLARHLPRGLLFDKSLGTAGDRRVRRYARLGYTIAALDEESTGFYANPDLYLTTRLSADTLEQTSFWFCISDRIRDEAIAKYPAYAEKFITTGLPRTDIWREPFHKLYEAERSAIAHEHGRFILFCSNFGSIIHARAGKFVDNQFAKQRAAHSGAETYQSQLHRQGSANLDAFIAMLPRLSNWFPDHRIIVRPHPSENRQFWRDAIAGSERIQIRDDGLATPWILASDCLVHHGCTTGIEAELLGKPHMMYAPHPDAHHDTDVMKAFAPIVDDETSLRDAISQIIAGDRSRKKDRKTLEPYYASLEGDLVSAHILNALDTLPAPNADALPKYLKWLRYAPRHLTAEYGPRTASARQYSRQKWKGTSLDEIQQSVALMAEATQLPMPQIGEPFPQLFSVEKRKSGR